MSTVEEIEVKALVSAHDRVWHSMMVFNTEAEYTEARRRLVEYYDVMAALDSETRKAVFSQTK
jgi:hypothetical protein